MLRRVVDSAVVHPGHGSRRASRPSSPRYVGAKHAIGCASGTDALVLSLHALSVRGGDEIVTTPFSFFASASCAALLGATPVFVDIEPGTFNIDAAKIEDAITPKTKAIVPVHLFGQCADDGRDSRDRRALAESP